MIHLGKFIRKVSRGFPLLPFDLNSSVYKSIVADRDLADQGATGIVEMLFCTSLVALVGAADREPGNSPRKLQIVNTKVRPTVSALRPLPIKSQVLSLTLASTLV